MGGILNLLKERKADTKKARFDLDIIFSFKMFKYFCALFLSTVQKQLVVIIGGPGTGKTTVIQELSKRGHCCYGEISRDITLEAKKEGIDQLFLENPMLFSELLLNARKEQHLKASEEAHEFVFLDRGIPDVLAYMHYIGDPYPSFFDEACKQHPYAKIFILPPWEDIYESDEARYENFEQASLIHNHIKETYENYGYDLIEVPKVDTDSRIMFILDLLSK